MEKRKKKKEKKREEERSRSTREEIFVHEVDEIVENYRFATDGGVISRDPVASSPCHENLQWRIALTDYCLVRGRV